MQTRRLSWIVLFVWASATASTAHAADTQPASRPSPLAALRTWPSLPPEKNAALAVYAVADDWIPPGLRTKAPLVDTLPLRQRAQWTAKDLEQARRWVDYWKPQIQKLEAIDSAAGFDWGDPPASPYILQPEDTRLSLTWGFAFSLLAVDGALACHDGDLVRAWRRAKQLACFAEGLCTCPQDDPRSAARLVERQRCSLIAMIAASNAFAAFAATRRAEVQTVAADLLDDRPVRQRYARYLDIEEAIARDTVAFLSGRQLAPTERKLRGLTCSIAFVLAGNGHTSQQIAVELDVLTLFRQIILDAEPFTRSQRGAIWEQRIELPLRRDLRMAIVKHTASAMIEQALDGMIGQLAHRQLAAVSLAVALYRADHGGQWPESLDQLVPQYLPAVPIDPLAREAIPLRYRSGENPIVWSSGDDGDDHSGAEPREGMSYKERERTDLVVPLTRRPSDTHP